MVLCINNRVRGFVYLVLLSFSSPFFLLLRTTAARVRPVNVGGSASGSGSTARSTLYAYLCAEASGGIAHVVRDLMFLFPFLLY